MADMAWVFMSVGAAFFMSVFLLINQYWKQPGVYLVLWSRILIIAVMTPFMFLYIEFPDNTAFYIIVFLTAVFGAFGDMRSFNVTAVYGGGVVSRLMPFTVFGGFFGWLVVHPELIATYLSKPVQTLGILVALSGCVWFSTRLKKCDVTTAAFKSILPAVGAYSVNTVLNKMALDHADVLMSGVFCYMYFQCVLALPMVTGYALYERHRERLQWQMLNKPIVIASVLMCVIWIAHMILKMYAMAFTFNPGYVAAILLTAPVFISVYYKWLNHVEEADVKNGMGVVACAILLILMTLT